MTEIEKIEYAKSFIDKLANGINPLDGTPIPESDIVNNVRLSRCFFYVSGILDKVIEEEGKRIKRESRPKPQPFSITEEHLNCYQYATAPISASAICRKINWIMRDEIEQKKMSKFNKSYIISWLLENELIITREWNNGKMKLFPTENGEAIGILVHIWQGYGRSGTPVLVFSEDAQRYIIENVCEMIKKGSKNEADSEDDVCD